jgi:hypothetical protein
VAGHRRAIKSGKFKGNEGSETVEMVKNSKLQEIEHCRNVNTRF